MSPENQITFCYFHNFVSSNANAHNAINRITLCTNKLNVKTTFRNSPYTLNIKQMRFDERKDTERFIRVDSVKFLSMKEKNKEIKTT